MRKLGSEPTVIHCPGSGNCNWRYDKHDKDWQCMSCGIWEKTAKRVTLSKIRSDNRDK